MKRIILLAVTMLLLPMAAFSQNTDTKEAIIAKEKQMYESIKTGDMATFKANLADDFMSVYAHGIFNRSQELENIETLKLNEYELSDIRVMQPSPMVAIITYKMKGSGIYMNEKFSGKYISTSTWVRQGDGNWKALLHTETESEAMDDPMGMQEEQ